MTEVMATGLSLNAPSSRQDIVSALLDGYGNSFGRDDDSPYALSPVPALKELPPPPPGSNDKSLPPVMMRFQLRVDEPGSYDDPRKNSIDSPTKIVSRSMSRSSKPPSLKLLASNGSTAAAPTPAPPTPAKDESSLPRSSKSSNERPLPPPPPAKSERRLSQRQAQATMGSQSSKTERRDSKEPQESENAVSRENPDPRAQSSQATKRKPLPGAGLTKKFVSLADLQKGPRGRSVAPKPTTSSTEPVAATAQPAQEYPQRPSVPSKDQNSPLPSIPRQPSEEATSRNALSGHRPTFSKSSLPSELPPTPDEQPPEPQAPARAPAPAPPPPRKVFAGLPSNPRAKSAETPTNVKHVRGKSSTGFDMMKGSKQVPPPVTTTNLNTITPGPTPSPRKIEAAQNGAGAPVPSLASTVQAALKRPQSPISPVSSEDENGRRPFSFEALPQSQPRKQLPSQPRQGQPQPTKPTSPITPPPAVTQFPPRTTSRPDTQSSQPIEQQRAQPTVQPKFPLASQSPTESAFVPLVLEPIPAPTPPITSAHLNCYTHHATFARYFTKYQPMSCMVCQLNNDPRKVSCHWCYLRICFSCQEELNRTPGRNLKTLLDNKGISVGGKGTEKQVDSRKDSGMPSVVVWEADEDENGREREDWS